MDPRTHPVLAKAIAAGRTVLTEPEAAAVLAAYGVPQPREVLARTGAGAVEAAGQPGFPVVLKLCSPDILHKSDVGGVRLRLGDAPAVAAAFEALGSVAARHGARWDGVLVQEQVPGDVE